MDIYGNEKYVTAEEIATLFPVRPAECHKGTFGYTALIGGSIEYSGAIRLAAMANAAMRSGAGVASVAAPRSICPVIAGAILEATIIPLSDRNGELEFVQSEFAAVAGRYDCIAIGMGIGNSPETAKAVAFLLENYDKTLIVDADGLNAMSTLDRSLIRDSAARLVLTPHLKEFSRLSGIPMPEVKADPVGAARHLAAELDATVLLKGSTTVVAGSPLAGNPECAAGSPLTGSPLAGSSAGTSGETKAGKVLLSDRGCPGMATAGSGDVLSGILSALCVNAEDTVLAAAAGAYINGAAGELAMSRRSDVTMTAADTANAVAETIESILAYR